VTERQDRSGAPERAGLLADLTTGLAEDTPGLPRLLSSACASVGRLLGQFAVLGVVAGDGSWEVACAWSRDAGLQPEVETLRQRRFPAGSMLAGRAIREGRRIVTRDPHELVPAEGEHQELARRLGLAAAFAVPLRARGRVLGSLVVGRSGTSSSPDNQPTFDEEDLQFAEQVATHMAVAVHYSNPLASMGQKVLERRRAETVLRAAFERAGVATLLVALDGAIVEANPAMLTLLGYRRDELTQMNVTELFSGDEGTDVDGLDRLLRGHVDSYRRELRFKRKDGRELFGLATVALLRDEPGQTPRLLAQVVDVTDERRARQALADSEAMFRALVHRSADVALVLDADMRVHYVSPAMTGSFGYEPDTLRGRTAYDFIHPDDVGFVAARLEQLRSSPGAHPVIEFRIRDADGNWRWVEDAATNLLDDPAIRGLVINLRDVSRRREAVEALRLSEQRYRTIVETASEGVLVIDAGGCVELANARLAEITGWPAEQLVGRPIADRLAGRAPSELVERLERQRTGQADRYETEIEHRDGSRRILSVAASPLLDDTGAFVGSVALIDDVTERAELQRKLAHLAHHDELTGLPVRAVLLDRLTTALARSRRSGQLQAVLFCDLDGFKAVNDRHGHLAGDDVLRQVSARLCHVVRPADTVARLGGDEFAIHCADLDDAGTAEKVAVRLTRAMAAPFQADQDSVELCVSIGIAAAREGDPVEMVRQADAAMYAAKRAGPGRIRVYPCGVVSRNDGGTPAP
jgi:diguanylate cyclase (GGDEF)-like protein/PAS domain S-box-containing protein